MSGERAGRMADLAARAATRAARRLRDINDRYSPQSPLQDARELTLAEYMAHYDATAHWAPGEGCTDPVCVKAAAMVQQAIVMFGQGQQA